MLSMRIDSLAAMFVEQFLIGAGGRDGEALHLHFDLGVSHFTNSGSFHSTRGLHLLYHLPKGRAYVDVFSAVTAKRFSKIGDITQWTHECSHDSCWRDTRAFSKTYFEMAEEVNTQLRSENLLEVAPKDMSELNRFASYHEMFRWVPVTVKKDPTDENNYRKLIEVRK